MTVVKVAGDAAERRSCTSNYWQITLAHLQVRKHAHERREERYRNGSIRPKYAFVFVKLLYVRC